MAEHASARSLSRPARAQLARSVVSDDPQERRCNGQALARAAAASQALGSTRNGNGQVLQRLGMDLGSAPLRLGFGAPCAWVRGSVRNDGRTSSPPLRLRRVCGSEKPPQASEKARVGVANDRREVPSSSPMARRVDCVRPGDASMTASAAISDRGYRPQT